MSSELSVQERIMFDQIVEELEKPVEPMNPALRFIAGVAIALCGFGVLLAVISSAPAAFAACLVITAGATLAIHARIRLGAFPNIQLPVKSSTPPKPQRYRPSPGRPGPY